MDPKFQRRQKEIARVQKQKAKREERAARRATKDGGAGDDDVAAIQAALDAGLNPGSAEARRSDETADDEGEH